VHVTSGSASYTLHTFNAEDFPRLPELDAATTFAVDPRRLLETNQPRLALGVAGRVAPGLTGILARFRGRQARHGRHDSYRLSVKETEIGGAGAGAGGDHPARALQELSEIAQSGDEVELGVHENQVVFSADGVSMTTRRIDGQFPNYRQLCPSVRARNSRCRATNCSTSCGVAAVMIERTSPAAAPICRGRADRDGSDA